jgi:hypothetical protein
MTCEIYLISVKLLKSPFFDFFDQSLNKPQVDAIRKCRQICVNLNFVMTCRHLQFAHSWIKFTSHW